MATPIRESSIKDPLKKCRIARSEFSRAAVFRGLLSVFGRTCDFLVVDRTVMAIRTENRYYEKTYQLCYYGYC